MRAAKSGGLCGCRDALGRPAQGVHAPRLFGLAAFDLLATAALAWLLARRSGSMFAVSLVFVLLIILAVAAHELFCVQTRLNAALFGRPWPAEEPTKGDTSAFVIRSPFAPPPSFAGQL